jgi:serine/threonine-protein kinase RsbW
MEGFGRDPASVVKLVLPAQPWALGLARLAVASLANHQGFSFEEIEDLRLAMEEACLVLMGSEARQGSLAISFVLGEASLDVEACLEGPAGDISPTEMSLRILEALVDHCKVDGAARRVHIRRELPRALS